MARDGENKGKDNPIKSKQKLIAKSIRKQKRAYHRLLRDMNIKCSDEPTKNLVICNGGLVTGLKRETLESIVRPYVCQYELIMPAGKSYCFIKCQSVEDAVCVYNETHGKVKLDEQNTLLFASFAESVPEEEQDFWTTNLPPGLKLIENVITEKEEQKLLDSIDWSKEESTSSDLKHRKVKHFGYEFKYGSNRVNINEPITPIPENYKFLQTIFKQHLSVPYEYDQLTINYYLPGQGIPPHIDTHSCFEDTILSLSLGSACIMDFRRGDRRAAIYLPPRSLLIVSGEARYAWSHGICPRHNDVVNTTTGITTQPRGTRVSFTYRKTRKGDCCCNFIKYCNTKRPSSISSKIAKGIEHSYVHEVYEEISNHFNETRHKQWPNVAKFLASLELGSLLLDVGCGNGKYLQEDKHIFKIGCDRSRGLIEICNYKGFEVLISDCLNLPYKDNSFDATISIAVIHHLSTNERRRQAIAELARVLRPDGKCLIYVWAKEQEKNATQSVYLKYGPGRREGREQRDEVFSEKMTEYGILLPVHENRTKFVCSDMLVPWKRKGGGNFLRYYHVFEEGELAGLCAEVPCIAVEDLYYDQGNWCVVFRKQRKLYSFQ